MTGPRWILTARGTWHAWNATTQRSVCGAVNTEDLRRTPVRQIAAQAPAIVGAGVRVCRVCAPTDAAGGKLLFAALPAAAVPWDQAVSRYCAQGRMTVAVGVRHALAVRLAEAAPSAGSVRGRQVFAVVRDLLLRPRNVAWTQGGRRRQHACLPYLAAAVAALPLGVQAVARVVDTVQMWQAITGLQVANERYRAETVIQTMLQVPDTEKETYMRQLHGRGLSALALMFHPATLERARRDTALHGAFSGSGEYWAQTQDQLHIVTD